MVLQEMKQAICPNTQFFDSLLLHLRTIMDDLFSRGNQYAMLENDSIILTKRIVASTSDSGCDSRDKGKRSCDMQDKRESTNHEI